MFTFLVENYHYAAVIIALYSYLKYTYYVKKDVLVECVSSYFQVFAYYVLFWVITIIIGAFFYDFLRIGRRAEFLLLVISLLITRTLLTLLKRKSNKGISI